LLGNFSSKTLSPEQNRTRKENIPGLAVGSVDNVSIAWGGVLHAENSSQSQELLK